MERAYCIEKNIDAYGRKVAEARGDMECSMIEFVLSKMSKEDRNQTSLKAICGAFITKVADIEGVDIPSRADQVVEAPSSSMQTSFDASTNVVQQTLSNHGWTIGAIVAMKKQEPKSPAWIINWKLGTQRKTVPSDSTRSAQKERLTSRMSNC